MEIFKELKERLKLIGILFADSNSKEKQLSIIKNVVAVTYFVLIFISSGWFRLFVARSTREITESSFFLLMFLKIFVWYSIFIWQRQEYAAVLSELAEKLEQSK